MVGSEKRRRNEVEREKRVGGVERRDAEMAFRIVKFCKLPRKRDEKTEERRDMEVNEKVSIAMRQDKDRTTVDG